MSKIRRVLFISFMICLGANYSQTEIFYNQNNNHIKFEKSSKIFTDKRDGQIYKTVKIGSQIWMAENLNFKTDSGSWVYYNDSLYADKYGRLYTWETACEVCPTGWHLPSKEDLIVLLKTVGNTEYDRYYALKSDEPDGFSALFSGSRNHTGFYSGINKDAGLWSSTLYNDDIAWAMVIGSYEKVGAGINKVNRKTIALSVRCVKD